MPHLHLSLQAGDDLILKRMKRRHSRADAIAFCEQVRRLRPDIVFGADLIAGFPTETEDMFARSLALVEECGADASCTSFRSRRGRARRRRACRSSPREIVKERARAPARKRRRGAGAASRRRDRRDAPRADRIATTAAAPSISLPWPSRATRPARSAS